MLSTLVCIFFQVKNMDNQTVKDDLYKAISEFKGLEPTADNETITSLFTTIKVFTDELPIYPAPQTQAEVNAYDLAHGQSEADMLYFGSAETGTGTSTEERKEVLDRLQVRATEIENLLRADS